MTARELFTGAIFFLACAAMLVAFSLWSLAMEIPPELIAGGGE